MPEDSPPRSQPRPPLPGVRHTHRTPRRWVKIVCGSLFLLTPHFIPGAAPEAAAQTAPGTAPGTTINNAIPATPAPTTAPPPPVKPPPPRTTELIDYDKAFIRLGDKLPAGDTIVVGLVEGNPGAYAPDLEHPNFHNLDVVLHSGPSKTSSHAHGTASIFTGRRGIAPRVKQLNVWAVHHWLTYGYLNLGSPNQPAHRADSPRVFSHSWVSFDPDRAIPILRRLDWVIDQHDVLMCVGVNNKKTSAVPPALGPAFNAIAIGVDTGNSSGGFTAVDTPGRCKPDIVAPGNMTSFATPAVAACAVILLQWADGMVVDGHPNANRAETIKAVLLAGATKHRTWKTQPGKPLDEHLGAGRLNLNNSLRILQGGHLAPGQRIKRGKAWAFDDLPPNATDRWTFNTSGDLGEVSFILTWHRRITGQPLLLAQHDDQPQRALWHNAPRIADLDLRILQLHDDGSTPTTFAQSTSRLDNVEHLYFKTLPAGRYVIEVFRDPQHDPQKNETWDYALAWRIEPPIKKVKNEK